MRLWCVHCCRLLLGRNFHGVLSSKLLKIKQLTSEQVDTLNEMNDMLESRRPVEVPTDWSVQTTPSGNSVILDPVAWTSNFNSTLPDSLMTSWVCSCFLIRAF